MLTQPQLPSGDKELTAEGLALPSAESNPSSVCICRAPHSSPQPHPPTPHSRQLHFPRAFSSRLSTLGERGPSDLEAATPCTSLGGGNQEAEPWSHLAGGTKQRLCFRPQPVKLLFLLRPALRLCPGLLFPGGWTNGRNGRLATDPSNTPALLGKCPSPTWRT